MATKTLTPQKTRRQIWQQNPPPMFNGDHLIRAEFERRYSAMPQLKKGVLIQQTSWGA
jgi:hypothetical protein